MQFLNVTPDGKPFEESSVIVNGMLFQRMIPQKHGVHRFIRDTDRLSEQEWNSLIDRLNKEFKYGVFARIITNKKSDKNDLTIKFPVKRSSDLVMDNTQVAYSVFGIYKSTNVYSSNEFSKFANQKTVNAINAVTKTDKYEITKNNIDDFINNNKQRLSDNMEQAIRRIIQARKYMQQDIDNLNGQLEYYNIKLVTNNNLVDIIGTFNTIDVNAVKNRIRVNG